MEILEQKLASVINNYDRVFDTSITWTYKCLKQNSKGSGESVIWPSNISLLFLEREIIVPVHFIVQAYKYKDSDIFLFYGHKILGSQLVVPIKEDTGADCYTNWNPYLRERVTAICLDSIGYNKSWVVVQKTKGRLLR